LKNLSAQLIDDVNGKTILSVSTFDKDSKNSISSGGNIKAAVLLGKLLAEKAQDKGVTEVTFDKGGRYFHGRIKAFADSARKAGLVF
jgi:large subunit ribosomal protein L18